DQRAVRQIDDAVGRGALEGEAPHDLRGDTIAVDEEPDRDQPRAVTVPGRPTVERPGRLARAPLHHPLGGQGAIVVRRGANPHVPSGTGIRDQGRDAITTHRPRPWSRRPPAGAGTALPLPGARTGVRSGASLLLRPTEQLAEVRQPASQLRLAVALDLGPL